MHTHTHTHTRTWLRMIADRRCELTCIYINCYTIHSSVAILTRCVRSDLKEAITILTDSSIASYLVL